MSEATISIAISHAERFLRLAEKVAKSKSVIGEHTYFPNSKDNAAMKRASLDLTRALADLRRSS